MHKNRRESQKDGQFSTASQLLKMSPIDRVCRDFLHFAVLSRCQKSIRTLMRFIFLSF